MATETEPRIPASKIVQIALNQDRLVVLDDTGKIFIVNRGGGVAERAESA